MQGAMKNYLDLKPSGFNSMPYKCFKIYIGRTECFGKQSRRNMFDICLYTNQTAQHYIDG